jgi:ATP-dependent Clp protease ATP-binding subunit ClpB
LLNRVDEKIVFHPLTREEIRSIVSIQVDMLRSRLSDQNWTLAVNDAALDAIADEGFDPVYGARPLKRVILQRLANPIATEILKSGGEGGEIVVRFDKQFEFEVQSAGAIRVAIFAPGTYVPG